MRERAKERLLVGKQDMFFLMTAATRTSSGGPEAAARLAAVVMDPNRSLHRALLLLCQRRNGKRQFHPPFFCLSHSVDDGMEVGMAVEEWRRKRQELPAQAVDKKNRPPMVVEMV